MRQSLSVDASVGCQWAAPVEVSVVASPGPVGPGPAKVPADGFEVVGRVPFGPRETFEVRTGGDARGRSPRVPPLAFRHAHRSGPRQRAGYRPTIGRRRAASPSPDIRHASAPAPEGRYPVSTGCLALVCTQQPWSGPCQGVAGAASADPVRRRPGRRPGRRGERRGPQALTDRGQVVSGPPPVRRSPPAGDVGVPAGHPAGTLTRPVVLPAGLWCRTGRARPRA
jgi:hypothetical protein